MSNISDAFKNGKAFIGFVTAGDPDLDTSLEIMTSMAQGGCDLIEIGIPFQTPSPKDLLFRRQTFVLLKTELPPIKFLTLQKSLEKE